MTETYLGNPPAHIADWIKAHSQPAATPSPYFTYDSNRVITGLHQGEPNIQGENGWTYGGSNVVENYAIAIGDYAFDDSDYYVTTVPPSRAITGNITFQNVISIGAQAFLYCRALTSIIMPNVTSIGEYAFFWCNSLTSISLGSVTNIRDYAFNYCSMLTSITIGSGIQGIGESAFATNGNPITLTIKKTVAEVQAMGTTDYDFNTNAPYLAWYLPPNSTIVCTDGTIPIS